jgi:DNA-binding transcriptional MerR regulator
VPFVFTYVFIGWVCWLILLYYKEFISLRQAHDQVLIESTTVERRSSLLDDRSPRGSGPQIMSRMRAASMVHRRSSASEILGERAFGSAPPDFYAGGAAGVVAAGGLAGGPTGGPAAGSSVASVAGSGSINMSISGGAKLVRRLSRAAPAPACDALPGQPVARISIGSQGASEVPPSGGAELIQYHTVSALGRLSDPGVRQQQPGEAQGPDSGSGGAASGQGNTSQALPPSPFAGEGLGAAPPPRARMQPGLRRITDSDGEGDGSGDEGAPDVEQLGGSGKQAADGVPPHWDELCEPLPLVASADAAQFYTVLIIDEAVEEFAYSKSLGKAWVPPKLLNKLTSRGRSDSQSIFEKSKALMKRKTKSEEEQERVNTCNLRMQVAEDLYSGIFGEDFDRIVPVYKTQATDALLARWHRKRLLLDRLRLQQQQVREQQEKLKQEVAAQIEAAERKLAELEEQQQGAAAEAGPDPERGEGPAGAAGAAGEVPPAAGEPQPSAQDQPAGGSLVHTSSSLIHAAGSQQGLGSGKLARGSSSLPGGSIKQPAAAPVSPGKAATACGGWHFGLHSTPPVARQEEKAEKLKARQEKLVQQVADTEAALAELQGEIEQAQRDAAEARPAPCFFATFHTAHAAAYAGRLNLNPLHERMMRVMPAPAPRNVNWAALFRSWVGRGVRPMPVFVAVVVMLLIPIGLFAGICGTIVSSVCADTPEGTTQGVNASQTWFCSSGFQPLACAASFGTRAAPASACERYFCLVASAGALFAACQRHFTSSTRSTLLVPSTPSAPVCRRLVCQIPAQPHLLYAARHPAECVAGGGAAHLLLQLCTGAAARAGC